MTVLCTCAEEHMYMSTQKKVWHPASILQECNADSCVALCRRGARSVPRAQPSAGDFSWSLSHPWPRLQHRFFIESIVHQPQVVNRISTPGSAGCRRRRRAKAQCWGCSAGGCTCCCTGRNEEDSTPGWVKIDGYHVFAWIPILYWPQQGGLHARVSLAGDTMYSHRYQFA